MIDPSLNGPLVAIPSLQGWVRQAIFQANILTVGESPPLREEFFNLSTNSQILPFVSFSPYFCVTSWPAYLSMFYKITQKSDEKSNKIQTLIIGG